MNPPNLTSSVIKAETKKPRGSQMTIFYAGKVTVFDDFPAEKAKNIISFASKGISQRQNNYAYTFSPDKTAIVSAGSSDPFPFHVIPTTANNSVQEHPQASSKPVVCDLPIARKASLYRFFEKRKYRVAAKAPYQKSNPMAVLNKTTESMSWLTLVPNSSQEESQSSSSFV